MRVVPVGPMVIPAPRFPIDVLIPFFPKFKRTPGAIFIDFLILNPIIINIFPNVAPQFLAYSSLKLAIIRFFIILESSMGKVTVLS